MRILLDTSYFLPLIKVGVAGVPGDLLATLLGRGQYELCYSDVTPFEIAAKGLKLAVTNDQITLHDVQAGLDALHHDARFVKIAWIDNPRLLELTRYLREIHPDFIDCLIVASAICYADTLATLDEGLQDVVSRSNNALEIVKKVNPKFCFWFGDLNQAPKRLIS